MDSITLVRANLQRSRTCVLADIEAMELHCLVPPTPKGGCHTLWLLGHLAYIEGSVIWKMMRGQPNPLAHWHVPFDGEVVSSQAVDYPSFAEVLTTCQEMRQQTITLLDSLHEAELDTLSADIPEGVQDTFGDYRCCFQFVADHWYMHRGQLADCRRAAGVTRMGW